MRREQGTGISSELKVLKSAESANNNTQHQQLHTKRPARCTCSAGAAAVLCPLANDNLSHPPLVLEAVDRRTAPGKASFFFLADCLTNHIDRYGTMCWSLLRLCVRQLSMTAGRVKGNRRRSGQAGRTALQRHHPSTRRHSLSEMEFKRAHLSKLLDLLEPASSARGSSKARGRGQIPW